MLAIRLLTWLMENQREDAVGRFRLKEPDAEGLALLEAVCRGRGWLLPGGVCDTDRGAAVVLDEFRAGKLGRVTLQRAPEVQA